MNKIVAVIIIAVFMAASLVIVEERNAKATETDWNALVGYSGPDWFCECIHTHYQYSDDCWVALGMHAKYDTSLGYNIGYNYGAWSFEAGVGGNNDNPKQQSATKPKTQT